MEKIETVFKIDNNHPALKGHFPARPVVPAVVLLSKVKRAFREHFGSSIRVLKLRHAKFIEPVTPGLEVTINIIVSEAGLFEFKLTANGKTTATGVIEYDSFENINER